MTHAVRTISICLAFAAACMFAPAAPASSGTNFSDQWWIPSESGWGASVLQQGDVLFVDLFVYGPDNKPVWYTAAAFYQPDSGRTLFSGDLQLTTGPWFGGFFNPAGVVYRKVGTLEFDATSTDTATLTYSVDGVQVVKSVERQLWTFEDFSGSYYGGFVYDQSACANPANNGHVEEFGSFQIDHSVVTALTLSLQSNFRDCTASGNYSQLGHMGTVDANFACTDGTSGTMTLFELERTSPGMTGRFIAQTNACGQVEGTLGGVGR